VPIVFALSDETIYSAVDRKPKRTRALARLANIAVNPRVCLLADHYENDWDRLWWVRADGVARVLDATTDEAIAGLRALTERHERYRSEPPPGPVLAIDVERWSGWSATG
jgi:PPOX class probable F420-dependent enzyme